MPRYEYKVVPAPSKGLKGKGVRGAEARFSFAVEDLMNGMAGSGWEYQRAETLPSIERSGLTGSTTEWRNVLVFRRLRSTDATEFQPELLPAPSDDFEEAPAVLVSKPETEQVDSDFMGDSGVEDTQPDSNVGASLSILARARKSAKKAVSGESGAAPHPDA
jgi:hypothetical protein